MTTNISLDSMMRRIRRTGVKKLYFTDGCLAATPRSPHARTTPRPTPQRDLPRTRHIPLRDLRVNGPKTKIRKPAMSSSASKILHNLTTMKSNFPLELQKSSTESPAVERHDYHSVCRCKLRYEYQKGAPEFTSPAHNKTPTPTAIKKPPSLPSNKLPASHHQKRALGFKTPVHNITPIPTAVNKRRSLPWKELLISQHRVEYALSVSESRLENRRRARALLSSADYDARQTPTGMKRPSPIPIVNVLTVEHQHGLSLNLPLPRSKNKRKAEAPLVSSASDMTPKPTGVMSEKRRRITPLTSPACDVKPMPTEVQKIERPPRGVLVYKLEDDHSVCLTEPRPFWMRL